MHRFPFFDLAHFLTGVRKKMPNLGPIFIRTFKSSPQDSKRSSVDILHDVTSNIADVSSDEEIRFVEI